MDQLTQTLETLILRIAEAAEKNNRQYYLGGGFAVDLSFGGLSRPHEDIDFYPMEEDTNWWKDWFRSQGFVISKDTDMENLPNAFSVLGVDEHYLADVYPIAADNKGKISMAVKEGTKEVWDGLLTIKENRGIWESKSWNDVKHVQYKGQTLVLEDYKTVLAQKEDYIRLHPGEKLLEKHLQDFARAGINPSV